MTQGETKKKTFTPDENLRLLIDPKLLSKKDFELFGPDSDFHIRSLSSTDHERDHLGLLSNLTKVPDLGPEKYKERFELLKTINSMTTDKPTYSILVIVQKSTDQLIGSGTLLLEHKFIRSNGTVGHIEDIVVDSSLRGKNLGRILIETLVDLSQSFGSYKTILDCNKENIAFYEKCGFTHKEYEMVKYSLE
ncbi:glucosamine 6-phosphate N-acetyltransferase [Phakopsora pachyrhizi]|uniref:Glucosamine 6-phosphate N-acetyltransferase n=1 Tax=Phakopsora pachyrhizi TaxID=170000 RepID=A0AAV0BTE6_PHAPC|nr:glucosamine 6-phosphate N-acetyltransferase [Phakopsora pachyrhizi]CAH7689503.1 glucosamine 6-phosphate N-acetyltransferase [Phakopsora pachyrhizi]